MKVESGLPKSSATADSKGSSTRVVRNEATVESSTVVTLSSRPVSADNDVDMNLVNEVRQAIAEGRFEINPQRIADNLILALRN